MSGPVTQAIILAAGRGSRLGAVTEAQPKPLLSLDPSGEPTLIGRQLDQLAARGVTRVTVVCGYRGDELSQAMARREGAPSVVCAPNARWDTAGSGCSLLRAADVLRAGSPVLITHGDVVFDDAILGATLAAAGPDATRTVVAADRGWQALTQDEVLAWTRDGTLAGVAKGRPADDADPADLLGTRGVGEFIGVSVLAPTFAAAFADALERRLSRDPALDYEQPLLSDFVARGVHRATVAFSDGVAWRNVNDAADLAWAREHFGSASPEPGT